MEPKHIYTSTGVKFWRHPDQMISFLHGTGKTVISTHISPTGNCNLNCEYCSISKRKKHEQLEVDTIVNYIRALMQRGLRAVIFSTDSREQIFLKQGEEINRITIGEYIDNILGPKKKDKEFIKIESNDLVMTSDEKGNVTYEKVTGLLRYKRTHPAYKVTLDGGLSIIVSDNHSICIYDPYTDKYVKKKPNELIPNETFVPRIIIDMPFETKKLIPSIYTEDFCEFLGIFIAEGYIDKAKTTIIITLNKNETELIDKILNISDNFDIPIHVVYRKSTVQIILMRLWIARFLSDLNYLIPGDDKPSRRKRIPSIIFKLSSNLQNAFLDGLLAGDGWEEKRIDKKGTLIHNKSLKTSSRVLADDALILAQMLKYETRIEYGWNNIREIEGREIKSTDYYRIVLKLSPDKILSWTNRLPVKISNHPKKRKYATLSELDKYGTSTIKNSIENNIKFCRVKSVKKIDDASEWFYDIEVGKTKNFFSSNGILAYDTGGGEPTIHPQWDEIVSRLRLFNLKFGLITNGIDLEDRNLEIFDWIRISVNFPAFDRLMQQRLPEFSIKPNCTIGLSLIYTGLNKQFSISQLLHMAQLYDASYIRVLPDCLPENLREAHMEIDRWIQNHQEYNTSIFLHQLKYHGTPITDYCPQAYFRPYLSEIDGGTIFPCDSVVLNNPSGKFEKKYAICKTDKIGDFLDGKIKQKFNPNKDCKGCVFTENVNMLFDWTRGAHQFHLHTGNIDHEDFV